MMPWSLRCMAPTPISTNSQQKNIMDLLLAMGSNKSSRSMLKSVDLSAFCDKVVKYLLVEFDGDCIFELPPLAIVKEGGLSQLEGMD